MSLEASQKKCSELEETNTDLLSKVELLDKDLKTHNEIKNNLLQKLSVKEKEITTLDDMSKELETQLKQQKTRYMEQFSDADN